MEGVKAALVTLVVSLPSTAAAISCTDPVSMWEGVPEFSTIPEFAEVFLNGSSEDTFLVIGSFTPIRGLPFAHEELEWSDFVTTADGYNNVGATPAHHVTFNYFQEIRFDGVRLDGHDLVPFSTDRTVIEYEFGEWDLNGWPDFDRRIVWVMSGAEPPFRIEGMGCPGILPISAIRLEAYGDAAEACLDKGACDITGTIDPVERP